MLALQDQGAATLDDNFDGSDVVIPTIKLLQGTSDQCINFEAASAGMFWHTGMDIPLGQNIEFTICSRRKKFLLQAPMDDGQGVLARSEDAVTWDRTGEWTVQIDKKTKATWTIDDLNVEASGLTAWGTSDPDDEKSLPAATIFYDYLVLVKGHYDLGPAMISLARSAIKKAKKGLNDKINLHAQNGRPLQAVQFGASVATEQNDSGQEFFNWQFGNAGFSDEETYKHAVEVGGLLKSYVASEEGKGEDGAAKAKAKGDNF